MGNIPTKLSYGPRSVGGGGEEVVSALNFFSDWRTAEGQTAEAISDGSKWNDNQFNGIDNRIAAISASGHGFPPTMNRVLRIHHRENDGEYSQVERNPVASLPAVGGAILFRVYFRHSFVCAGEDKNYHPYQATAGTCAFHSNTRFRAEGPTFPMHCATFDHDWQITLDHDTTYRYEEKYVRAGVDSWFVHCRVARASDEVVIRTDADFSCTTGHGTHTLADGLTSEVADTCIVRKQINWQGSDPGSGQGNDDDNNNQMKWGGFACAVVGAGEVDRWIGTYPHPDEA